MKTQSRLRAVPAEPIVRLLIRISESDGPDGSIETQRQGGAQFAGERFPGYPIVAYVDDGIAGDDFLGRAGLNRLLADVQPGDVVVARDESRLGREIFESGMIIKRITERARLFYYRDGTQIAVNTPLEKIMVSLKNFGAEEYLRTVRANTTEAIRRNVRDHKIGGGRCYGYDNVQNPGPMNSRGRRKMNTDLVVNPAQAPIVCRIFAEYRDGAGHKRIASRLNADGITAPAAGQRGTGSWSTSAVGAILRNEKYHGVYVHNRVRRVKRGGKRLAVANPDSEWLRVPRPEWRIVDEATWAAVQAEIARRGEEARERLEAEPAVVGDRPVAGSKAPGTGPGKYALSGISRCTHCKLAIGVGQTKVAGGVHVKAYGCYGHISRGNAVCPVTVRQPIHEVEGPLADHLQATYLTAGVLDLVFAGIHAEAARQLAQPPMDTTSVEAEVAKLKGDQKRCAQLLATLDDAPEIAAEYKSRTGRIRRLEADIAAARRAPAMQAGLLEEIEASARAKLKDMRAALTRGQPQGARDVYKALFPTGLWFSPVTIARKGRKARRVWKIEGVPSGECLVAEGGSTRWGHQQNSKGREIAEDVAALGVFGGHFE